MARVPFALALTQRELIQDPAVIDELDRAYARINGFLSQVDISDAEGDLDDGIDNNEGAETVVIKRLDINSDLDSFDPELADIISITPTNAARTINGIRGGFDGRKLIVYVPAAASQTLTFGHEVAAATADERMQLTGAASLTTVANEARGFTLVYDGAETRWVQTGGSAAVAAAGGASGPEDIDVTETEVVNSSSQTSIYSHAIAGAVLSAGKGFRFYVKGHWTKNGVAAANLSASVTFGSTTLASGTILTGAGQSSIGRATEIWGTISCIGASDQRAACRSRIGNTGTQGTWVSLVGNSFAEHNALSLDLTGSLTLDVLITMSVADAANKFERDFGIIEVF